ncbi:MAG: LysM peptidoglycan-binding domain-containing protein [Anaerolineae bacterium]
MKDHKTQSPIRFSLWISMALAVVMLTAWANGAFAQSTALVKIIPNEATISVGQTIEMAVQVENITNLYGVEMLIRFDPTLLEVVDADPNKPGTQIAPGEFLRSGLDGDNAVIDGTINYAMQQVSPTPPASGSGVLVRITFRGTGSGTADIRIEDLYLSDQAGQGIGSALHTAQITIQAGSVDSPAPTPPPQPTAAPPTPPPPTPVSQPTVAAPAITAQSLGVNCAAVQGYHIVQRGETLYAIARAYATNPYAISACNPTINPRRIHASNHLAIPYAPWTPPPGPTAARQFGPSLVPAPVPTPAPGCRAWHPVQPGETLTAIGLRYSANIWDIARANRIYNLHLINAGQTLCIP